MTVRLFNADCCEVLKTLADASVDSIVTDPPYELTSARFGGRSEATRGAVMGGFMGMKWDGTGVAFDPAVWRECLRVLKPGGHLLAFGGTRTYHRMVCAIEDAGFEVRDQIGWLYASGFPKSHNLDNLRGEKVCGCALPCTHDRTEPASEHDLRSVRSFDVQKAESVEEERRQVLQPGVQEQGASTSRREELSAPEEGCRQPCLEGWGDSPQSPGELRTGSLHASTNVGRVDGEGGRLRDGAPSGYGSVVRVPADADGVRPSCGSRPPEQQSREPRTVARQPKPQAVGAWPVCRGCGLPVLPQGLGTALKPAWEPIVVARKALIGTVAENVLAHGTGALNIDGCRVPSPGEVITNHARSSDSAVSKGIYGDSCEQQTHQTAGQAIGRWPANVIHDGSDEVVALFPAQAGAAAAVRGTEPTRNGFSGSVKYSGMRQRVPGAFHADIGSAARFFYCAKASRADRNAGLGDVGPQLKNGSTLRDAERVRAQRSGNHHPTVKPTAVMRYLCRLVTPPGGLVLDPFMGSGSTGRGAVLEGFSFVGIEKDTEEGYFEIARRRIAAAGGVDDDEPTTPEESASSPLRPAADQQSAQFDLWKVA